MRIKTYVAAALCAPLLTIAGAGTAFAGEVSGPPIGGFATGDFNPIYTRHVAKSICAFSGLNAYHDETPEGGPKLPAWPPVQSYGMAVKGGAKAFAPSPGDACNGRTGWLVNPPSE
jgi:hypothetical protein